MATHEWGATTSEPASPRGGFVAQTDWRLLVPVTAASSRLADEGPEVWAETARAFVRLMEEWREQTAPLSSVTEIVLHPAYQRIIGMGRTVVPLILAELARQPDHWFWALRAITGENPVAPEDAGDVLRMRRAWLRLGHLRGWLDRQWTS